MNRYYSFVCVQLRCRGFSFVYLCTHTHERRTQCETVFCCDSREKKKKKIPGKLTLNIPCTGNAAMKLMLLNELSDDRVLRRRIGDFPHFRFDSAVYFRRNTANTNETDTRSITCWQSLHRQTKRANQVSKIRNASK